MTAGTFSRWELVGRHTLAFERFTSHHTELNDLYWSYVPTTDIVRINTRGLREADVTGVALKMSGPDARRPPTYVGEWRKKLTGFSNWTRLGMIMSAASYLELYMSQAIFLALRSDPMLPYKLPRHLDGMTVDKRGGIAPDFSERVQACCRGPWAKRLAGYRRLFGFAPASISENISELESLRKLRNEVGHAFGRPLSTAPEVVLPPHDAARLSEARLKKWLSLIGKIASEIEDNLGNKHIGSYELLYIYHTRRADLRTGSYGGREPHVALATLLSTEHQHRVTRGFCEALIKHYLSC